MRLLTEGSVCRLHQPVNQPQGNDDEQTKKGCAVMLRSEAELPVNVTKFPTA